MDQQKIARINELYRKSKAEGLTEAEKKEQKILRTEYMDSVKRNLRSQLNNIDIEEKDGSVINLGEKYGNKKSIRQIIGKQRKELDPIIWQSQTAEICRKTCELDVFREATDIYCYIDFGGEVGTRPLMLEAWKLGKTVWVPKVHGETMEFL